MSQHRRTWRTVDGERVEGTWRPAFIRNGDDHYLTDLVIYADGVVDCWDLVTLAEFELKLASGWVATEIPDGARASAHHLASWTFSNVETWMSADMLLGEVRDEVERLNGRPDSSVRCVEAALRFAGDPSETNQDLLRAAYDAVPEHLRTYMLGDMDSKDLPVQFLVAGPGHRTVGGVVVTEERHAWALQYFADREHEMASWLTREVPEPEGAGTSVYIPQVPSPLGHEQEPGLFCLRNEFPAEITVDGHTYPSVDHAYWATAVLDHEVRARVLAAEAPFGTKRLVRGQQLRDGWEVMRLAVMTDLLRAKFAQHPDLAAVLVGTGASRLLHTGPDGPFWVSHGDEGRNWLGRLLELVRSEQALEAGRP
ncbi:hypothetical protein Kisp01_65390 [Kineosporia sp. NBRC 101677]|uniref:NADAR family protein n=1 Tax=Kineosporia sp. NBRC 101677 TaxID=3032197 RepID=UPI0024A5F9E2|nr:NADAR family protein [Kineosporia sp. NBRC 101677]GLY19525.1 hypothetical protein Kisp01_65390 [Kineosporia sp. NBRC 101677]